jgi:hypothetical protein
MPPPSVAELPLIMLLVMVAVPELAMPPPSADGTLPLMVLLVTVRVSSFSMPPPKDRPPQFLIVAQKW